MPKWVKCERAATLLFAQLSNAVWLSVLVAEFAAIIRLLAIRVWILLPFFCSYLVFDIARSLLLWSLGTSPNTKMYRTVWIWTEPWAIALDVLVTFELYKALYRAYPGINRFARIVIAFGIVIAIAATFFTLTLDFNYITWRVPDVQRLFLMKRIISSVIAIFLAITMIIFPRAECATTIIQHGWLLTGLFVARALGFFLANLGINSDWISIPFLAAQCGLYLLWAIWLTPRTALSPPRSAEDIERTERWNRELLEATHWLVR